ncbi:2-oxoglutarate/2-oxoacid ferredoxin oxidoreductase, alpha subunit [Candidatus Syntrophocurvum alkaliphilum]|uniref:2-oxoglutarate/2-oxoacid ferredoxin oxidoreductase, alpha subunit n=1 Tax=Candidatus Syntrophocurvum alkaliphilum TaxID=2293317 RepID=A0A6I6D5Z1_9FIRM|nr:3-methyl-2-oxobutanoate dehydrogenase subunit VorB [Candidatus Syntrophocurvum alkaliphilum]QGT98723.1 2-oxoglutarate/2-oxoacid ferredoxin oxidoreductase, alpha subunit [Candidatus Syntrophocurvum alkaliphilum]
MSELVLMKGNEAIGEAAIKANCRYFFGYPITPQTEVLEHLGRRLPEEGGSYVQAESEISAINMVFGAASAGARVMTASSSPGISLMQEGISYIASAQLPAVIVNIMRGAPGLGGIHPSQADYTQSVKGGGHGDYKLIVLAPSSVQELIDFTILSFELAEKYRTPVVLFGDGMLGQMMEPVVIPEIKPVPIDRPWATTGMGDRDKPNIVHTLYLPTEQLEDHCNMLFDKYQVIEQEEKRSQDFFTEDAEILLVSFGIASRVTKAAVEMARENGIKAGLFRPITLWPFPDEALKNAAKNAKLVISSEINMGQMIEDVRLTLGNQIPIELFNRIGQVPTPDEIFEFIKKQAGEVLK